MKTFIFFSNKKLHFFIVTVSFYENHLHFGIRSDESP